MDVLVLVVGASLEELLPKTLGVGFPVLLAAVQFAAPRRSLLAVMLLAIAAGATEEAISSLEPMTCVSYFVLAALFVRRLGLPLAATAITYPCYQVWLFVWTAGMGGGIFNRVLLAFPIGLATAFAVGAVVDWVGRKAALNERS